MHRDPLLLPFFLYACNMPNRWGESSAVNPWCLRRQRHKVLPAHMQAVWVRRGIPAIHRVRLQMPSASHLHCLYCRQCYCPNIVRPACDIIDSGRGEKDNVTSQSNTACCMPVFASAECQSSLNDIPISFKIAHVLVDVQYVDYTCCHYDDIVIVVQWIFESKSLKGCHSLRMCSVGVTAPSPGLWELQLQCRQGLDESPKCQESGWKGWQGSDTGIKLS